jgi:cytochrome c biogenesis protein CcdA
MGIGSVAGAFVAGVLTVLSPCVLPILPIVLGAAASERKYGPAAGAGDPTPNPIFMIWRAARIRMRQRCTTSREALTST